MLAIAILDALFEKLVSWAEIAVEMLPNLAVALVLLVLSWFAGRAAGRAMCRGLAHLSRDGGGTQLPSLAGALTRLAVTTAGLFVALGILHLDKTVTSLLAGIGVVGLALGFAFQDLAANLVSGVLLATKKPFVPGDVIQYGAETGTVVRIDLRETQIRRFTGEVVIVPNRKLLESELTNVTQAGSRRIDIEVGVAYDTDLDQAQRVAREAVASVDAVLTDDHEIEVLYVSFGGSSIDMQLRFWVDYVGEPVQFVRARSEVIKAVKRAFDEADISIPFPIRTLDVPRATLESLASEAA